MTNLERLQGKLAYPLKENTFIGALLDRGLDSDTDYNPDTDKRAMDLAMADCAMTAITTPNITESGFQLSHSNKGELRRIADGLYAKWNESNPFDSAPKIVDKTSLW